MLETAEPVTREKAVYFAARITARINEQRDELPSALRRSAPRLNADCERVRLDLEGFLRALDGLADHSVMLPDSDFSSCVCGNDNPCPDARRNTEWRDAHLAAMALTGKPYGLEQRKAACRCGAAICHDGIGWVHEGGWLACAPGGDAQAEPASA